MSAYDTIESTILSLLFKYYEIFILYVNFTSTYKNHSNHSLILTCVCVLGALIIPLYYFQQPNNPSTDSFTCLPSKNRRLFGFCPPAICIYIPSNISNYHFTIFAMPSNPLVLSNNNNNSYYKWKIAASPSVYMCMHIQTHVTLEQISSPSRTHLEQTQRDRHTHFRVSEKE